jgi:hypothetical protein
MGCILCYYGLPWAKLVSQMQPALGRLDGLLMPDHIADVWWGRYIEKDGLRSPDLMHGMRHAARNGDKIPSSHDPPLIAHTELDLPLNDVQEMIAGRVRMAFDAVFQTIDPNVHLGRLGERGEPKPFVLLKYLELFDLNNCEFWLIGFGQQGE